ncbi:histidine phosphatase family protein [Bacillus tianshenii]|nr:histidine phosphatase family protein [Bacillus tianshenii]
MTEICFIRHGQTDWNVARKIQGTAQTTLNETGKQQAAQCAQHLQKEKWDRIITSPLQRAVETAEIIGSALGIETIMKEKNWGEREYGEATGWSYEQLFAGLERGTITGIESEKALSERAKSGLNRILQDYPNQRILVVSHGVTILAALNAGFDTPLPHEEVHLKNGCLNRMKHSDNRWNVLSYNDQNHLLPT